MNQSVERRLPRSDFNGNIDYILKGNNYVGLSLYVTNYAVMSLTPTDAESRGFLNYNVYV